MSDFLTRIHINFDRTRFNYYVRFGVPKYQDRQSPTEAYWYFPAGATFGYVRWEAGQYGTEKWRFFILRGTKPGSPVYSIPGVNPGAEVLADVSGKERVHRLLESVDAVEAINIKPCDVAPWHWVQCNARINSRLKPCDYSPEAHAAWRIEKVLYG